MNYVDAFCDLPDFSELSVSLEKLLPGDQKIYHISDNNKDIFYIASKQSKYEEYDIDRYHTSIVAFYEYEFDLVEIKFISLREGYGELLFLFAIMKMYNKYRVYKIQVFDCYGYDDCDNICDVERNIFKKFGFNRIIEEFEEMSCSSYECMVKGYKMVCNNGLLTN